MKTSTIILIIFLTTSLIHHRVQAQCPVTAFVNPSTVLCGQMVNLTAVADGCRPLNNNFNDGTINAGGTQPWQSTNGATVQNGTGAHSCVGPPAEGAYSLWMGTDVAAPRAITTNGYDLTACSAVSATLCFDMKYGYQGGPTPCEGIDLPEEGVYIQYRIGAGAWQTLQYYDPNGGTDPNLTQWRRYCIDVPLAALGTNTSFRWYQDQSSGAGFDAWGLDNMVINLNVPGYTFDWAHDAQGPSSSPSTPAVQVTSNSTYTVTYTNGVETCSSNVSVTVISPTASATITPNIVCAGNQVQLDAISSIVAPPPSTCGVNADAACTPFSTIADEQQVGTGTTTIAYNTGGNNVFGNYGDAYQTAQILFRASELTAAGIVAGQINSLSFDIERIETSGGGGAAGVVYPNIRISMGCTNRSVLGTSGGQLALATGLSQVYSGTNVNITPGMFPFFFNQSYNWDGVSNIVVQVCWFFPNGTGAQDPPPNGMDNYYAFCRYNSPGYGCYRYSGTNFSPGGCSTGDFVGYNTRRPNVLFGFCKPSNAVLTYNWISNPAGFTSNIKNPTHNPTQNTTYTVAINQSGMPAACAATANVNVTTYRPAITITPNPAQICAPATSVNLVASATTNAGALGGKTYTNTTSGAIAEGTGEVSCTGALPGATFTRTITVSGASPATIGANPIQSLFFNLNCPSTGDFRVRLISPAGTAIILVNRRGGTGDNFVNTTFTPGASTLVSGGSAPFSAGPYIPENLLNTFPAGENVNGTWTLEIIDYCKPFSGTTAGTFVSWGIVFNAPNEMGTYTWSPPTSLSSTNTAATTCSTTSTRTYTVTATDNSGCSNTATVTVNVGCVLPVELISFGSSCKDNGIWLNWEVASQHENKYFIIERSEDGITFESIGQVKGDGTFLETKTFEFQDLNKSRDNFYYYRLAQVDLNGQKNYLKTILYKDCIEQEESCIKVFPTVVMNRELKVKTAYLKQDLNQIFIFDMYGKLVYETMIDKNESLYVTVPIPESIRSGMYYIKSNDEMLEFCEQKIIIQ